MKKSVTTSLSHQAPHVFDHVDGPIRVRAKRRGFYGHSLREPGDEFGVHSKKELGSWMELVEDDETATAPKSKTEKPAKSGAAGSKTDNDVL